jgi:prepilin-type N-terminal cleavage/methylation domain-containing protein
MTRSGFTLVELLVVIGIVGVLLTITLVAINPARQFAQANNVKRSSDLDSILNAVTQLKVDYRGVLPTVIPTLPATPQILNSTNFNIFCEAIVTTYIAALPFDSIAPSAHWTSCDDFDTGYTIYQEPEGRVVVAAPYAEPIDGIQPTIQSAR